MHPPTISYLSIASPFKNHQNWTLQLESFRTIFAHSSTNGKHSDCLQTLSQNQTSLKSSTALSLDWIDSLIKKADDRSNCTDLLREKFITDHSAEPIDLELIKRVIDEVKKDKIEAWTSSNTFGRLAQAFTSPQLLRYPLFSSRTFCLHTLFFISSDLNFEQIRYMI